MAYIIIIGLILLSALFSGLTLGLMSLSASELKRKATLGDKDAAKVYEIRKRGNLLLTTLLIGNVAVNTALSIFLGSVTTGFAAGLIATSLIVVFGEITPQAIFSRFAISLGARMAWLVKIFVFILYPISGPISWVLDKALGEEMATIYSKKELMKIIEEHEDVKESDVDEDEEKIVKGALTFSDKTAEEVMTPKSVAKMLEASTKIDAALLREVKESGYSRIPVYEKEVDNVVGVLYFKALLDGNSDNKVVRDVVKDKVYSVQEDKKLDDVFRAFLSTRNHLFIVHNKFKDVVGVITLEDVLEEIIGNEIMDEDDVYEDLRTLAKEKRKIKIKENDE